MADYLVLYDILDAMDDRLSKIYQVSTKHYKQLAIDHPCRFGFDPYFPGVSPGPF